MKTTLRCKPKTIRKEDLMKTYTYDEVLKASLKYFDNDDLAANVFVNKYALKTEKGEFVELTPDDMHRRLAKEFARIESKYSNPMSEDEIYDLLVDFKYIVPQGSPMSAMGNSAKVQSLSNCFVIEPPGDSYGSIARADEEILQLQKRRGGVGVDLSNIRPKGVPVRNAAGTSDGIAIFMERYSNTTREVAQGGRRGALMETISCFVGKTPILTDSGWIPIETIVKDKYCGKAWTHEGFKQIDAWQDLGEQDVYEVECDNGKKITVTSDHQFVVKNIKTGDEYLKKICDVDSSEEELVFYNAQFD